MPDGPDPMPEVNRLEVFGETPAATERIAPGYCGADMEAEHVARYRWASAAVRGQGVLDVACGTGYGSALLIRAGARSVCSLDVSAAALAFGRARYAGPAYARADALDIPLRAGSIDVAVSLETIEHLIDARRFLVELRRVLRPGGTLRLSSPNVVVTGNANPYHVDEMTLDELQALLRATGFRVTGVWGQCWRLPARRGIWRVKGFGRLAHEISRRRHVWNLPGRLGFRPAYWCLSAIAGGPSG